MKQLLIPICILVSLPAFAQKHSISINYKPGLSYFGKQKEQFDLSNSHFQSRDGNSTFRNSVNILYSYRIASKFTLSTGVEYAEQGQNIDFNAGAERVYKVELNYWRIPLTLSYDLFSFRQNKLSIYSGVSIGFAAKKNDNYQYIITENILLPPAEKRYKDKDWAIPLGINLQKNLSKMMFVKFGAEYMFGLTNAFSDFSGSRIAELSQFAHSKQSRASLNIGVGIRLPK